MPSVIPSNQQVFETRDGEWYLVATLEHRNGVTTYFNVPDSAASVSELPRDITVAAGLAKQTTDTSGSNITITNQTTGASGLGFTWAAGDGVRQVTINTDATSGTYKVVVRGIGSAGGTGSTKGTSL